MLAPVRLATAPEPLQAAQLQVLLMGKVGLAAVLSIRRTARPQSLAATKGGPEENGGTTAGVVGARGAGKKTTESGKIIVEIVKAETTTTKITTTADHHEDRHWDREDDRTGWQDWNDRDDQEDEQYGRAYWRSRRKLPRQSALAYKSGSSSKKQLFADEELLALVPVSDRSSFESEFGSVEERSALVRLVGVRGFTLRGFVWGALCFAAAVLSSTRDVVLLGLRCLWCLSAAVRNRLAHSLNGNQDGLYPWILCGIISLATYRVGEEFADGAAAVVRVTTEAIEDVFETTSIEVQETIQWVGMFVRMALVVAVWYVGRTCWSKLMHVLHGNTATPTKGPTGNVEAWRFLLNEPASTRPIGICSRVAVEGAETIYQVEGSNGASYRSVLHDTDRSKIRCSCKAYVFSGKHCKHLVEIARRESVHGTEKDAPAAELPLAIARGRAASTAQALAVQAQANSCLDGLSVLMQKAATISSRGYGRTLSSENSRQPLPSPERIDAGNFADTPLQGIKKAKEGPKELVRVPSPTVRPAEPVLAVKFVPNFTSQQILVDSLREWPKCDVTLVAYSFDQPQVVEALESHQGRTRLLADLSQTNGKTKQQYQVLLRLQRAGCSVRVGSGTSVRNAYLADRREISAMGSSIRGIIHGKSCLLVEGCRALSLVGSCNWTTSSKSNLEFGVQVEVDAEGEFVRDYLAHFEGTWAQAESLDSLSQDPRGKAKSKE